MCGRASPPPSEVKGENPAGPTNFNGSDTLSPRFQRPVEDNCHSSEHAPGRGSCTFHSFVEDIGQRFPASLVLPVEDQPTVRHDQNLIDQGIESSHKVT